jgi:hypothetical protein
MKSVALVVALLLLTLLQGVSAWCYLKCKKSNNWDGTGSQDGCYLKRCGMTFHDYWVFWLQV